jgi:hypothetical protein
MKSQRLELIFELVVFGTILGVIEDIIAIKATTDAVITFKNVLVVVAIAIPFAVVGEVAMTRIDFTKIFNKIFSKKSD